MKPIQNCNISRIILGLMEIGSLEIEDLQTNISISKNIANLSIVEKAYGKSLDVIKNKYVKKDEVGAFMQENGIYLFSSIEDKEAYASAITKLNESVVTEELFSIKISPLQTIKGIKAIMFAKCDELMSYSE